MNLHYFITRFRWAIVFLGESFFLVNNDWRSRFFVAYWNTWTLDASRERWILHASHLTLVSERWTLGTGLFTMDARRWTFDVEHWTLWLICLEQNQNPFSHSTWLNYWNFFGCESLKTTLSHLFCNVDIFRNSFLTLSVAS